MWKLKVKQYNIKRGYSNNDLFNYFLCKEMKLLMITVIEEISNGNQIVSEWTKSPAMI